MNNQCKYIYKVYMKCEDHSVHCERLTVIWANDEWVYVKVPGAHDLVKLSVYSDLSKNVHDAILRGDTHLYKYDDKKFIFRAFVLSNEDYDPQKIKSYFTEIQGDEWLNKREKTLIKLSGELKRQIEVSGEIQSRILATGCLIEFQFNPFRVIVTDPLRVNPETKEPHKWTIDFKK